MTNDPVAGRKIRWSYDDGPVKGMTFEHSFTTDGEVTFREVKNGQVVDAGGEAPVKYEAARIGDGVYAVSYLATSGWTLTTIVDEKSRTIVSFASNEKSLVPQRGRLV
jgi:hypothetical protein